MKRRGSTRKQLGYIADDQGNKQRFPEEVGIWRFDEDDYLLYALLCDPVYCAELLGSDSSNYDHGGMFVVRDYQYPLFRVDDNYSGFACARSVGKTESIKWRSVSHAFRRIRENLLLTAPELIHLLPLTDAIEAIYRSVRILREFLEVGGGKTGFTHRPFGIDLADGTKVIGRIPRLTGTGVKGQHQPDLIVDEAQDYPPKGWTEVHETVLKDHVDREGNPDFSYIFYGVHSGARDTGFHRNVTKGAFKIHTISAIQRQGWNAAEKAAARAAYGGTSSPDYRRNILGEPGGAASPYFVSARLTQCMDLDRESRYNTMEAVPASFQDPDDDKCQLIRAEEFADLGLPIAEILDLPEGYTNVYGGMDVGLTISPTVITLFSEEKVDNVVRLKLFRRIQLERMRTKALRHALYAIGNVYGENLKGFGMDITGLGFPIWQEMEDDEYAPAHLMNVSQGYFFNAKVPVDVEPGDIVEDGRGGFRDRLGHVVEQDEDPLTGETRWVTFMPMIEASTRYLRELVDSTKLMLPFDPVVVGDMQGETQQRVKRIAGLKQKPNAFHILDSMRAMAMKYRGESVEVSLRGPGQRPVLEVVG